MATQIQLRRDTASNWSSTNPTLAAGEFGWESDTNKFKIGTGSAAWNSLGYASEGDTAGITFVGDDSTGTLVKQNETFKITGTQNITAVVSGDTLTLTGPDLTSYLTASSSTTLTNKNIDADNNTVSNIEVDNLKSGVLDTDISSVAGTDTTLASAKAIKTYVDAQIATKDNTDEITEGSSNLYFTNARADARITNALKDEDNMASDSATHVPSQQSVKAYVDAQDANVASDSLTFTNKTIDANATGNSITNLEVADLASGVLDTDISSVSASDNTLASAKAIKTYVDAQIATKDALSELSGDTDDVSEGSSNLYFTNARADARISNAIVDEDNMSSNSATQVPSQQSVKAYVDAEVAGVVDSAPSALNTLNELAAALGDDANFATTTSSALGNRLRIDVNNQGLTSTQKTNAATNLGLNAVATSGAYSDLSGTPTIPSNTNELTNGAGFITDSNLTVVGDDSSGVTFSTKNNDNLKIAGGTNITTAVSGDTVTITGPDTSNFITGSSTTTLTNKTFDVEGTGNSISNIDVADLKSGVLDTDISSVSSSDDTLASAKAIKTYVDAQIATKDNTDEITEGSSNLYYTDARAQAVSINNVVEDTTPQLGGNLDLNSNNITGTGNISTTGTLALTNTTTDDSLLITTTEDSSTAAPVITMKRNSGSPADGDYLGQVKFKGENDADQEVVYAKMTGKISDASDSSEDGLIEFTLKKAGANNIGARLTSTELQLMNGTGLELGGNLNLNGNNITGTGNITTTGQADIDFVTIKDNKITTNATNADLQISANGTGQIQISPNDASVDDVYSDNTRYDFGANRIFSEQDADANSIFSDSGDRRYANGDFVSVSLASSSSSPHARWRSGSFSLVDMKGKDLSSSANYFKGINTRYVETMIKNTSTSTASTLNNISGVYSSLNTEGTDNGGGLTIDSGYGFVTDIFLGEGTSETTAMTDAYHYAVKGSSGGGAITNEYGLYVDGLNGTNKYGLYVNDDAYENKIGGLEIASRQISTTSNGDITLAPNGTGKTILKGNTNPGTLVFNCENNSHGQTVKAQPHSASVTNTLTLPAGGDQEIVGTAATQTLTNKTLTSPVLNTGVSGTAIKDEDNMASNSATHLATQQSIKAYVDAEVAGAGGGGVTVQDEGSGLSTTATTLNFVGAGVTASGTGATKTITISGGGGSADTGDITFSGNKMSTGSSNADFELETSGTGAIILKGNGGSFPPPNLSTGANRMDNANILAYIDQNHTGGSKRLYANQAHLALKFDGTDSSSGNARFRALVSQTNVDMNGTNMTNSGSSRGPIGVSAGNDIFNSSSTTSTLGNLVAGSFFNYFKDSGTGTDGTINVTNAHGLKLYSPMEAYDASVGTVSNAYGCHIGSPIDYNGSATVTNSYGYYYKHYTADSYNDGGDANQVTFTNDPYCFYTSVDYVRNRPGAFEKFNEYSYNATHSANGAYTIDWANGNLQTVTLGANITGFTMSNFPTSTKQSVGITLYLVQDGTGSRGMTFSATGGETFKFANGVTSSSVSSANDIQTVYIFSRYTGSANIYYWTLGPVYS